MFNLKIKVRPQMDTDNAEDWFRRACAAGKLDPHPGTVHYVGDMMFMYVLNRSTVAFKHRITRDYLNIPVSELPPVLRTWEIGTQLYGPVKIVGATYKEAVEDCALYPGIGPVSYIKEL